MELLLSWLILAIAVWATAYFLPGVHIRGFGSAIIVAALLGILNFFLGWLFFGVFAIATLGLAVLLAFITRWIIDAIFLKIIDAFSDRLDIEGFRWAFIAAAVMSLIGSLGEWAVQGIF